MSKYYVVSGEYLPDVLEQVMQARILLQSGGAKRISEAVKMVGISHVVHIINIRMQYFHLMLSNPIEKRLFQ